MGEGPSNPRLAHQTEKLRGLWRSPGKPKGVYFSLTRLHETEPYAYGWYCDAQGKPIPGTALVKLHLNGPGTAPAGFRRVKR